MNLNHASQVIDIIDGRVAAMTGTAAKVNATYASVAAVTGGVASAYLYGDTTPSEGFRARDGFIPKAGDAVRVAINGAGDRWIEEVIPSAYFAMQFDVTGGVVHWADPATGTPDTNLYRSAVGTLKTDNNLIVIGTLASGAATLASLGVSGSSSLGVLGAGASTLASLSVTGQISGIRPTKTVLTSGSGTYTVPANVTHIIVECVGGGGAGGGASTSIAGSHSKGGGGGSGGYARSVIPNPAATYAYAVGGGGAGVSGAAGGGGGNTSIAGITAYGGAPGSTAGYSSATYSGALGGAGGGAGGADIIFAGAPGGYGYGSGALATGGTGAPCYFGGGGQAVDLISSPGSVVGNNAPSTGSGGGGAATTGTGAAQAGGNGSAGAIIITEFYAS